MNLKNILKDNKQIRWLILILTIIIPCSGYVLLDRSARGLMMLMWMFVLGYLTMSLNIFFGFDSYFQIFWGSRRMVCFNC